MRIFVNGDQREVEAATLAVALDALGYGGKKIATAVNGRFVPAPTRQIAVDSVRNRYEDKK